MISAVRRSLVGAASALAAAPQPGRNRSSQLYKDTNNVQMSSKIITTGGLNAPALPPARPRARVCVRYQQNNTEDKKTILFLTDQIRHTRTHAYICVVCRPTRRQSTSGQYNGSWTVRNERGMRE